MGTPPPVSTPLRCARALLGVLTCAVLCTLACALGPCTARAQTPPPCDPGSAGARQCLAADPFIVERLTLRAAANGLVFATTSELGEPQLRVLDDAGLTTRGVLPMRDGPLLYQSGFLYTTASAIVSATATAPPLLAIHVAAAARPALVGAFSPPWQSALDWASVPGALYVLAANAGGDVDLHVLSLEQPGQPRWVGAVPSLGRTRILAQGNLLAAAGPDGFTLYDITAPLTPALLSTTTLQIAAPLDSVDLAAAGQVLYVLGRAGYSNDAYCRIIDVRAPRTPVPGDLCPFIPFKSTFAQGFAYVNPNTSPAEYLDYAIYTLANPAAPLLVGTTAQHWRAAYPAAGGLVAQDFGGHLVRLGQSANGSLAAAASTWRAADLDAGGKVRAIVSNLALVDTGTSIDGARVVRLLDLSSRTGPVVRGTLISPWIGAQRLVAQGTRLCALHNNRFTLFDAHNPAQVQQIGQFTSPLDESLEHMALGRDNVAYLVGARNTLLSVDFSTPTTPTLASLVKLPGSTELALVVAPMLYLFGADELLIVDISSARQPTLLRTLPVAQPEAATLWGQTLYLIDQGALQMLDVSAPGNPQPVAQLEPPAGMRFALVGEAQAGRLVLHQRDAAGSPPAAQPPALLVYDLSLPNAPRLLATLPGAYADPYFDGAMIDLPGPRTVAIGPRPIVRAPVPNDSSAPSNIPIGIDAPSGISITYTLPAPALAASAAPTSTQTLCLRHEGAVADAWLPPLDTATYAGPFLVSIVDCATDAPAAFAAPITLTVRLPATDAPPRLWSAAALYVDNGPLWLPMATAQRMGSTWTATLTPPLMWGVRGPAPAAVHLPLIAR